jgi:hypothetical protein
MIFIGLQTTCAIVIAPPTAARCDLSPSSPVNTAAQPLQSLMPVRCRPILDESTINDRDLKALLVP